MFKILNKLYKNYFLGLCAVFSFAFSAQAARFEIPISATGILILKASEGQINISPSPIPGKAFFQYSEGNGESFQFKNTGTATVIEGSGRIVRPSEKNTVSKQILELQIPPQAILEVHLLEGNITVAKANNSLFLHLEKGKISSKETQGALSIHQKRGETLVSDHKGTLIVDSFNTQLNIRQVEAEIKIDNFNGETVLEKTKGRMRLSQNRGSVKSSLHSGGLILDLQRATYLGQQVSGRIEGQSEEGSVAITLGAESEVNFATKSARVVLTFPANSVAQLNLNSVDGDLVLPPTLKINRDTEGKSFKGKWRGENPQHFVNLKTNDGALIIK
jgi:hypothetical protein